MNVFLGQVLKCQRLKQGWMCKYLLWAFLSIYYPVHRKASEMIEMYFFQAKPVSPIALHGLRHRAHPTG